MSNTRQTEANRVSKRAALHLAETEHERNTHLLADGAISQAEFDRSKTTLESARADAASAEAGVVAQGSAVAAAQDATQQADENSRSQRVVLDYYRVAAPLDGIVGDIPIRIGDSVTPSTALTTVERNDTLEAYVSVPVERAPELHVGQTVELVDSDGHKLATTHIFFIAPGASEGSQTVLAKTRIEGPAQIKASQLYRARVIWSVVRGVRVPMTAITRVNGQPFVYVVENAPGPTARQRPVTLGQIDDNQVVVEKGVNERDRVVVSGVQKLRDGAPVQPTS